MASTILTRTLLGTTETSIQMSNSTWARPITLPNDWNKIRIGIRAVFTDNGSGPSSTPRFSLGLCSGTTNIVGDSTTTYFAGVISNSATWTYAAPPNAVYYNINTVPCVKTGSLLVSSSAITTDARFSHTGSVSSIFFLDITKGTPDYTFNVFTPIGSVPSNVTSTTFLNQMQLTSPVITGYSFGTARTMSIDESLSGSFNAVNCWWNRADFNIQIEDLAVAILS